MILFGAVLFVSCSTTVQVENSFIPDPNYVNETFNGDMYDVDLLFYDSKDRLVGTKGLGKIKVGDKSEKVDAPKQAEYFKIYFDVMDDNIFDYKFVTAEYCMINKGENTILTITENTSTKKKYK